MNEQTLLEEFRAMRAEMQAMREQMSSMIGDTNKKLDIIGSFVAAMNEAQTFEKTMHAVENVTKEITDCEKADFIAADKERFFCTDGERRNYIEPENADEIRKAMESGKISVRGDAAIIPVQAGHNSPVGVIIAEKQGGFDSAELSQLESGSTVMNTVSLAIDKEVNHRMAVTDELTSLKNRDGLNEYLKNTLSPIINDDQPASILMCDIDYFKKVNDTYGHDYGDFVLKGVADIISANTRGASDSAFRVGGEEMVSVLCCDTDKAAAIAERIRAQVENTEFYYKGTIMRVTLSIGVHQMENKEMQPENARTVFDKELKEADKAVYEAKSTGRNRVIVNSAVPEKNISQDNRQQDNTRNYIAPQNYGDNRINNNSQRNYGNDRRNNNSPQNYGNDPRNYTPPQNRVNSPQNYSSQNSYQPAQNDMGVSKQPTYYNKEAYSQINNKTYINTDSRTAYEVSREAQRQGVEHSVKYNGSRSSITVDGIKDRRFVETIERMSAWADKVQIKAAQIRENSQKRNNGAR